MKPAQMHKSMNELEYRTLPGLRSSKLKEGLRSMAHLRLAIEKPDDPLPGPDDIVEVTLDEALEFGNFFHSFLMEPAENWMGKYHFSNADRLPWNRKDGMAQKEALKDIRKPIVWPVTYSIAEAMRDSVHATPFWRVLETIQGSVEIPITGRCQDVEIKCKLDVFDPNNAVVVNLKTTRNGDPRSFDRDVIKLKYWLQAAIECELVEQLTGKRPLYYWFVVEKFAPYNATAYQLDELSMDEGRAKLRTLLCAYKKCVSEGVFPGYNNDRAVLPYRFPTFMFGDNEIPAAYIPEE